MSSRDQVPGTSNVADERGWRAIQRELQDIRRSLDRLEASFGLKRKIEMADVIIAALPPDSVDATHGSPRPGGSSMHDLRAQLADLQRDLASVRAAVQRALDAWQRCELRGMIEEVEKDERFLEDVLEEMVIYTVADSPADRGRNSETAEEEGGGE